VPAAATRPRRLRLCSVAFPPTHSPLHGQCHLHPHNWRAVSWFRGRLGEDTSSSGRHEVVDSPGSDPRQTRHCRRPFMSWSPRGPWWGRGRKVLPPARSAMSWTPVLRAAKSGGCASEDVGSPKALPGWGRRRDSPSSGPRAEPLGQSGQRSPGYNDVS
jgi:hypothetical protein